MVAHGWESITLTFLTISKSFDLKKKSHKTHAGGIKGGTITFLCLVYTVPTSRNC